MEDVWYQNDGKTACALSVHSRFGAFGLIPGARFSKDPVTTGPVNLPGRLTGNFTGPGIAFLEAPVNFPDTYRAQRRGRRLLKFSYMHHPTKNDVTSGLN